MSNLQSDVDKSTACQLIDAIYQDNRNRIKVLLAANINGALAELFIKQFEAKELIHKSTLEMLLEFETDMISPYHLSALLGQDHLLQVFLLREIPVDSPLDNGVTALHMASLSGHVTTIRLLCDQYQAFINKVDTYGWSPLHYACSAGQVDAVKELMSRHCDVKLRDKDGTTAAFRADICGRYTIVDLICGQHNRQELLEINEAAADTGSLPSSPRNKDANFNRLLKKTQSVPLEEQEKHLTRRKKPAIQAERSARYSNIRRVIQKTLDESLGSGYLNPQDLKESESMQDPLWGVGIKTLRKILCEEFEKYKLDNIVKSLASRDILTDHHPDYAQIKFCGGKSLCAPGGPPDPSQATSKPPLPPPRKHSYGEAVATVSRMDSKDDQDSTTMLLKYIFRRIAPVLAPDWKCLARKLGMFSQLWEIEATYPGNREKQAYVVLESWRQRCGRTVDVDDLTLALRSAGLFAVVQALEKVSQEITA